MSSDHIDSPYHLTTLSRRGDLWAIDALDEKWVHLQRRKFRVEEQLKRLAPDDYDLLIHLQGGGDAEIDDCVEWVTALQQQQPQQPQDEQERASAGAGASKPSRFRSVVDGFDEADAAASSSAAAAAAAPKILAPSRLRGGASLAGADGGAGTLWSEILANRK